MATTNDPLHLVLQRAEAAQDAQQEQLKIAIG
jgi:hypothetical protein